MIKIILIILLLLTIGGILFLKEILFFVRDEIQNISPVQNIQDISTAVNKYQNIQTDTIFNDFKSYSIIDLYSENNINKIKETADIINKESENTDSILNLYAQQVVNVSEKITTHTLTDIKKIAEDRISSATNQDININEIKSNIASQTQEIIKGKVVSEIKEAGIKDIISEKTTFIDSIVNSIQNQLNIIKQKKEELLK